MNFENFIEEIKKMVKEYLGGNIRIEEKTVLKNNGVKLTGIVIVEEGQNCVPNIYLNGYFEEFKSGRRMGDILYEIARYYEEHKIVKQVNMDYFSDYKKMKDKICFRLINYNKNEELLKEIPHIPYLDLAIVFYCIVHNENIGSGSILIRNEHLRNWNVDIREIQSVAFSNAPKLLKGEILPMEDVICKMMKNRMVREIERCIKDQMETKICVTDEMIEPIIGEMMQKIYSEAKGPKMYVASNENKNFGASVILYDDFLKQFANETGEDYFILPSSIHEVILIPVEDEDEDVTQLREMVCDVNETELEREEILSDSVYLYKRNSGIVTRIQ